MATNTDNATLQAGDGSEDLLVDGSTIYWTTDDAVRKVPLAGGTPVTLAGGGAFWQVHVNGSSVYWVADPGVGVNKIMSLPK